MKKKLQNIAIELENISKQYTIHHEKPTLVEKFIKEKNEKFVALNNITFTIHKGEKVGIIGPNGSGKTTLLKIISHITTPTSGTVKTFGKVVSLIDLEAGFHEDLTGYENIFLNGLLIGMTKKEIEKKLDRIISFADIKQFIDSPLFTYSQGMKLRLGFSISIHSDPDILILDEGLGVGDAQFNNKSQRVLGQFTKNNKTFLVATHWMEYVYYNCNKIIALKNGMIDTSIF